MFRGLNLVCIEPEAHNQEYYLILAEKIDLNTQKWYKTEKWSNWPPRSFHDRGRTMNLINSLQYHRSSFLRWKPTLTSEQGIERYFAWLAKITFWWIKHLLADWRTLAKCQLIDIVIGLNPLDYDCIWSRYLSLICLRLGFIKSLVARTIQFTFVRLKNI